MDWLEDVKGPDQPSNSSATQLNQIDINDAFDKIAVESFEAFPTQVATAPAAVSEKQKGHKYLSKKKQGKRK